MKSSSTAMFRGMIVALCCAFALLFAGIGVADGNDATDGYTSGATSSGEGTALRDR